MKQVINNPDIITIQEVDFKDIIAFRDTIGNIFIMNKLKEDNNWVFGFLNITYKQQPLFSFNTFEESMKCAIKSHQVYSFKDQFEFAEWILSFKTRLHGIDTNVKS